MGCFNIDVFLVRISKDLIFGFRNMIVLLYRLVDYIWGSIFIVSFIFREDRDIVKECVDEGE